MSLGTCSNEMRGQFVNSDVTFQEKKSTAGNLLEHLIFNSKLALKNLFFFFSP